VTLSTVTDGNFYGMRTCSWLILKIFQF
jgi:hypothetical protein